MKKALFLFAAGFAALSYAVTFAPKEYVDKMDAENRAFTLGHVADAIEPLCTKLALQRYMPIEGTNTADFTVGTIRSTYGHVNELEIGMLLKMGSWELFRVNGVSLTQYGDSRYVQQSGFSDAVQGVVNAMNIKGGGVSQQDLLPFGKEITHAVMMSVVTNDLPNLTWDKKLEVGWKKTAENGCFYETAYTNVEVIVTGELQ